MIFGLARFYSASTTSCLFLGILFALQIPCIVHVTYEFSTHILRVQQWPFLAVLWDAILFSLQLRVELNICDECTIHLDRRHQRPLPLMCTLDSRSLQSVAHKSHSILSREVHHPFLTHGHPHLHLSTQSLRWEVHLGAVVLRSRTLPAKKTNMTMFISLMIQDCLLARDQKRIQCPKALIKIKEQ